MPPEANVDDPDLSSGQATTDPQTENWVDCLGDWLERATNLECQAHQARNVLSMGALTASTGFAVVLLATGKPWLGVATMALFAICAVALFHIYDRQAKIRGKVAKKLQLDQKAAIEGSLKTEELRTADERAMAFWPDEGIHVLTGRALIFYLMAAVMFAPLVLYVVFEKSYQGQTEETPPRDDEPATPVKKPSSGQ